MILIRDYTNGDRTQLVDYYLFIFDYLGKPYAFDDDVDGLSDDYCEPWYVFIKDTGGVEFNTHRMMYAAN